MCDGVEELINSIFACSGERNVRIRALYHFAWKVAHVLDCVLSPCQERGVRDNASCYRHVCGSVVDAALDGNNVRPNGDFGDANCLWHTAESAVITLSFA